MDPLWGFFVWLFLASAAFHSLPPCSSLVAWANFVAVLIIVLGFHDWMVRNEMQKFAWMSFFLVWFLTFTFVVFLDDPKLRIALFHWNGIIAGGMAVGLTVSNSFP